MTGFSVLTFSAQERSVWIGRIEHLNTHRLNGVSNKWSRDATLWHHCYWPLAFRPHNEEISASRSSYPRLRRVSHDLSFLSTARIIHTPHFFLPAECLDHPVLRRISALSALRYITEECPVHFRAEEFHDPFHLGAAVGDGILGQDLPVVRQSRTRTLLGHYHYRSRVYICVLFLEVFRFGQCGPE